ncbi:MAG TPA: tRNA dihydrouridine(16) synthase DusC [Bdellovibrionales bacterium]|nr:tRNA dihydrouridine(16) synthase DusC [Pseudobdellovibrionaceae bacterium]HAG90743.1 tRNA dihydrouridine(16) synthase DusC [Bdellovibrionales bacterium]
MFIQVAPMEGVVDFKVRDLLTQIGGVDRTVTEFVRVTNRLHPPKVFYKYAPELQTGGRTLAGVPVYVQLLGSDPEALLENAHLAFELGASGVDLNFGCPAKTVNRHDGGATLLKDPSRIFKVVDRLRSSLPAKCPVTAKVRLGFEDKGLHREIAQAVDEGGASQLVIHARTRNEGYRPPAHWEYIGYMADAVTRTRVVANGDLWSLKDYADCVRVSGIRDVALGRALVSRPDLALELKRFANDGALTGDSSESSYHGLEWRDVLRRYLFPLFDYYYGQSPRLAVGRLKQSLKALGRNYPEAVDFFDHVRRETNGLVVKSLLLKERNSIGL